MKKENMLVVEDEDIMREALSDYFSDGGHKVDTANDGDKALEKFNLEDYNVMIVDLKLPGRDGLSVLKEIRAKNPQAKIKNDYFKTQFNIDNLSLLLGTIRHRVQEQFDSQN